MWCSLSQKFHELGLLPALNLNLHKSSIDVSTLLIASLNAGMNEVASITIGTEAFLQKTAASFCLILRVGLLVFL